MALFKAVVWALIFLTKLRFPPGVSIAIVLKVVFSVDFFDEWERPIWPPPIVMRGCR